MSFNATSKQTYADYLLKISIRARPCKHLKCTCNLVHSNDVLRYAYIFLVTAVRISEVDEAIIRILEEHNIKFNIIKLTSAPSIMASVTYNGQRMITQRSDNRDEYAFLFLSVFRSSFSYLVMFLFPQVGQ